jgi:nucleotide-binding universal stress UspA family protein
VYRALTSSIGGVDEDTIRILGDAPDDPSHRHVREWLAAAVVIGVSIFAVAVLLNGISSEGDPVSPTTLVLATTTSVVAQTPTTSAPTSTTIPAPAPVGSDENVDPLPPTTATANTYVDAEGLIWYETDCPDADVVLFSGADRLPAIETTERAAVEAFAKGTVYTVIPRNGWVWERLPDGSVLVSQVEDYMLERTIESVDQCPPIPSHNGMGIPVAYRVNDN